MPGPKSPDEIVALAKKVIPEEIFEVVNELLAVNWTGNRAVIKQKDIVDGYRSKVSLKTNISKDDIPFDNNWFNIEQSYMSVGWSVKYDKPAYNETYESTFEFKRLPGNCRIFDDK